eukprot:TRINITY_DN40688_c0_g1_i1.p1 TRINITY_DN40688_c0_g1~~TRINITY_DN40688_c0_g1_i1.p1  ORF type:complete len:284 (-),score=89.74 TRINITY_DN40688_c0_g1_i1:458-1309(-)
MFGGGLTLGFGGAAPAVSPEKAKRQDEKSTCLPVTIRATELAAENAAGNDGEFRFYGASFEHSMIIVVGAVEAVHSKQGTCLEFTVNDSTGRLRVRHFATEASQTAAFEDIVPGRYVSLFGNMRSTPQVHMSVQGFRLVNSADDISHHMIQAAHAALKIQTRRPERLEIGTPAPKQQRVAENTTPEKEIAMEVSTPMAKLEALSAELPKPAAVGPISASALKEAILAFLQEGNLEVGHSAVEIVAGLKREVEGGEAAVRKTLAELVEVGDVANTIDDDHFAFI